MNKSPHGIHTIAINEEKSVKLENRELYTTDDPEEMEVLDRDPEVEKMRKNTKEK